MSYNNCYRGKRNIDCTYFLTFLLCVVTYNKLIRLLRVDYNYRPLPFGDKIMSCSYVLHRINIPTCLLKYQYSEHGSWRSPRQQRGSIEGRQWDVEGSEANSYTCAGIVKDRWPRYDEVQLHRNVRYSLMFLQKGGPWVQLAMTQSNTKCVNLQCVEWCQGNDSTSYLSPCLSNSLFVDITDDSILRCIRVKIAMFLLPDPRSNNSRHTFCNKVIRTNAVH